MVRIIKLATAWIGTLDQHKTRPEQKRAAHCDERLGIYTPDNKSEMMERYGWNFGLAR